MIDYRQFHDFTQPKQFLMRPPSQKIKRFFPVRLQPSI